MNAIKEAPVEIGKWIESNLEKINQIYDKPKIFQNYLYKNMPISNREWLAEFKKELNSRNSKERLQLIYDIYLAYQGLHIEFPEGETEVKKKWKKF